MAKRKLRKKRVVRFFTAVLIVSLICFYGLVKITDLLVVNELFIASAKEEVTLYDDNFKVSSTIPRGTSVRATKKVITNETKRYNKIKYKNNSYLIEEKQLVEKKENTVLEKERFVRTPVTIYNADSTILGFAKKGTKLTILGYENIQDNGYVERYKINYDNKDGYVYAKYLVDSESLALKNYDEDNSYQTHLKRVDNYNLGAGNAGELDYYPVEKANFEDNKLLDEARTLYLNGYGSTLTNVDKYIELAQKSNINAFVVDIKDGYMAYESEIAKKYSMSNYKSATCYLETYKTAIDKLKNAGFYVVGRINVFKDSHFAKDNPETAITDISGNLLQHNGSYWPSAFQRKVWEFNVELAKEAVQKFGFNEIQFDYCRFPDGIYYKEKEGQANLQNEYKETKSQAIQQFLYYATDEIHKLNAYVSVDVFGESAYNYVTGYGQYWPAISNIVDVISAMPYPDHFNAHEFGITEVVWTVPYKVLNEWASRASLRQKEIPTPAKVRTWIQAYNAIRSPYNEYGATEVGEQIKALYDNGLNNGYITWNALSSLEKYESISNAFKKDYR